MADYLLGLVLTQYPDHGAPPRQHRLTAVTNTNVQIRLESYVIQLEKPDTGKSSAISPTLSQGGMNNEGASAKFTGLD